MPPKTDISRSKSSKKADPESPREDDLKKIIGQKNDEILELQERIRLLSVENETLRKRVSKKSPKAANQPINQVAVAPGTPVGKKMDRSIIAKSTATPTPTPTSQRRNSTQPGKPRAHTCSCKGNCSSKMCGCVKKDQYCSEFCRCSNECKNLDPNGFEDEDKENAGENQMVNEGKREGDFYVSETEDEREIENKNKSDENDTSFSSGSSDPNSETAPNDGYLVFKPTKTLARSPLPNQDAVKVTKAKNMISPFSPSNEEPLGPFNKQDSPNKQPLKPKQELISVASISEGDESPVIDWNEHKRQLVPCTKCNRKFFPDRKRIHEAACKNI